MVGKNIFFPRPPPRLRIWSSCPSPVCQTGSAISCPASACSLSTLRLNLVLTHHEIPPDFSDDGVHSYCQPPSGQSRVYRVTTQVLTDGVHCRESADTGPAVFKVVPVTSATFSGIVMDQPLFATLFPRRGLLSLVQCPSGLYKRCHPGSSEVPRNPLTRWDVVSSIPANGIFLTKKLKNNNKNAQRVENE